MADPDNNPDALALSALREQWGAEQKVKKERFVSLMTDFLDQPAPTEEADVFADEKRDAPSD